MNPTSDFLGTPYEEVLEIPHMPQVILEKTRCPLVKYYEFVVILEK